VQKQYSPHPVVRAALGEFSPEEKVQGFRMLLQSSVGWLNVHRFIVSAHISPLLSRALLVPKLRLGTACSKLRFVCVPGNGVSSHAFPNGVWERGRCHFARRSATRHGLSAGATSSAIVS